MIAEEIFKNYDIRGVWGKEWDREGAQRIAQGLFVHFRPRTVAIGRDMRLSSEEIFSLFAQTLMKLGVEVWDLGLISTDVSYFVSGHFRPDLTIMITASHNPPEYNGLKVTLPGGDSVSLQTGLGAVKEWVFSGKEVKEKGKEGKMISKDPLEEYKKAVFSLINPRKIAPLRVVVDAGNGMAGKIIPLLVKDLPVELIPVYFDLDGSFPHHLPNPLLPEAMATLQKKVREEKADLGAGFDGDGDRVVLVDEKGELFSGTEMTAMLAEYFLHLNPGRVVCYNAVCGRTVPEVIQENGGIPVRTPVGYSIIKKIMREKKAIFAGEHSYHFFFPHLYYADSGATAFLTCLEIISQSKQPASSLRKKYARWYQSGEINFLVEDKEKMIAAVEKEFSPGAKSVDYLDGLSVWFPQWWFNLRASNTQPLLRLNIEAKTPSLLAQKQKALVKFIQAQGGKRSFE